MEKPKYYTVEIYTKNKKGKANVLATVQVSSLGLRLPVSSDFDNTEDGKFVFYWSLCDAPRRSETKVRKALQHVRNEHDKGAAFKFLSRLVMSKDELIEYCNTRLPEAIEKLTLQCNTIKEQLLKVEDERSKLHQHLVKFEAFKAQQDSPTRGKIKGKGKGR